MFTAAHCHERGAHRDFGFAEADVAAHQAIHGLAGFHIVNDGADRSRLVGRFFKRKSGDEVVVVVWMKRKREAFAGGALGVEIQQLCRRVAHLLGGFAFRLFPLATAETMQWRGVRAGAAVTADLMQLRNGHVQFVAATIFKMQKLRFALA